MLLSTHRCLWGAVLAAAMPFTAAAQKLDITEQLEQGQRLRTQGHWDEARTLFAHLLRTVEKDQPDIGVEAIILDNAGINETDAGNYTEAEIAFNRALSVFNSSRPNDPILASLKADLAELYIAERRPEDGEPLLRQAAAILRSAVQPDTLTLSLVYDDLAVACVMEKKYPEAESLVRQAMGMLESELGPSHYKIANALLTLVGLQMAQHHYVDALSQAERAWQILRAAPVPDSYLAGASSVVSAAYFHTGRQTEAESYARHAVDLAENAYGLEHPQVAFYLSNYALILKHGERKKQAREIQSQAATILARRGSSDGPSGYTVNVNALR